MIKVMLIDDHHVVRNGVKALLEAKVGEIKVVCEAENGEDALKKIPLCKNLDLIIADMSMPGMSGIDFCRFLKESKSRLKVLIFSIYDDDEYIIEALNAGAVGYLTKDSTAQEIYNAISTISEGKMYYSSSLSDILARQILRNNKREELLDSKKLTNREKEVLDLIVKGYSNKEIAEEIYVSKRTVDNHRSNLMKKLGARNTADIVRIAFENQLIQEL